jgi:hypothetical protein
MFNQINQPNPINQTRKEIVMHSIQQIMNSISEQNTGNNGCKLPASQDSQRPEKPDGRDRPNKEEIVKMIMNVALVSRQQDPVRAGVLSDALLAYNLTRDEIMQGCKRYVESLASNWREIQLSDFLNPTITSERQLREEIAKLREEREAFEEERKRFYQSVQEEVERRLSQTYIELKNISEVFQKAHRVVASRAVESAMAILRDEQRERAEELCKEILRTIDAKVTQHLDSIRKEVLAQILSKLNQSSLTLNQ